MTISTTNFITHTTITQLTLSPPNKLSSAKLLVYVKDQSASMSLKVGENPV